MDYFLQRRRMGARLPPPASILPSCVSAPSPSQQPQVHDRPGAFDIRLEGGQVVFSAESPASLPEYSDLFARLRQAGLQAVA